MEAVAKVAVALHWAASACPCEDETVCSHAVHGCFEGSWVSAKAIDSGQGELAVADSSAWGLAVAGTLGRESSVFHMLRSNRHSFDLVCHGHMSTGQVARYLELTP